eukprot:GHRR01016789.1.p1 GENE.GHRR01016789.1~~GHRR01016789.1.p1  ORF type:complete len:238 (+),score=85.54 GHRR01016789.1:188-901(+)
MPLTASQRMKFFDKPSNLASVTFDDINVYTFVVCQSIMDLPAYKLSLGGFLTLDLCQLLNGQPLQLMCKNVRDNKSVMSMLMWHERLNYPLTSRATRSSSSGSRTSYSGNPASERSSIADSSLHDYGSGSLESYSIGGSSAGCSTGSMDFCSSTDSCSAGSSTGCVDTCSTASFQRGEDDDSDTAAYSEYGSATSEVHSAWDNEAEQDTFAGLKAGYDQEKCAVAKLASKLQALWRF